MNNCLPIKKNIFKEGTLLGVIQPHSSKQIKTPNWQIFARGIFPQSSRKKKLPTVWTTPNIQDTFPKFGGYAVSSLLQS